MSAFIQVIEWRSSRIEEIKALQESWRARFPEMGPSRITVCAERERPDAYMTIVEFPSYEAAMANSAHPATSEFAEKMQALCDGPAIFHDLDVMSTEIRTAAAQQGAPASR